MRKYPFLDGRWTDHWFLGEYARLWPGEARRDRAESPFEGVERKFVIACTPRVGSSLLCQHLIKYGVYVAEFFNPLLLEDATHAPRATDCRELCANLVERYALNGAWGVKAHVQAMVPLFLVGEFPANIKDWRFVHLTRDNVVRQAISYVIAQVRQSWSSSREIEREVTEQDYSQEGIALSIRSNRLSDASWERFFALHGIEPLRLTYEQITADPVAAAARVAAHCGLGPGGQERVQAFDDPPLVPQTTTQNSIWEARFRREAPAD
jgi:LPS sulfotransferase NodH